MSQRWKSEDPKRFAGCLAIASPLLDQTDFARAVLLLLQHSEQGAFGAVLNRRATEPIQRAWTELAGDVPRSIQHLSLGGPLAGPVFALHRQAELGEQQVQAGLYFCASKESLVKLAVESNGPYRIFFGAAGWGPGQLELEVDRGIWHMLPASDDVIFYEPDQQWDVAIRRYGRYLWEGLGVRGFPADSQAN